MFSLNLFVTVTLFLTAGRAYYIPNSNYVIQVAETPQYLYTPTEHAEELSGYSYVTSDLNGARSNVIFTTGPDAMGLFKNQANLIPKPIDTMMPERVSAKEVEPKSENAEITIPRMEENSETIQSQDQVSIEQPTFFQAQNSLLHRNVYNLPVSTGFQRFYSPPLSVYNQHFQPYSYNPYAHLNAALNPFHIQHRHPFTQLFYPQPVVSSTTNSAEVSQTQATESSTSEASTEEQSSTNSGTVNTEVTVEASAISETSENMKEEATVMSMDTAMQNEELNSTEEPVSMVSKEMQMENESSTVSMDETTDMASTVSTNDM